LPKGILQNICYRGVHGLPLLFYLQTVQSEPSFFASQLLSHPGTTEWDGLLLTARRAAIEAVRGIGGTSADGEVFFQTAVAQSPELSFENAPDDAVELITTLALAHYRSWLMEHGQEPPAGLEANAAWLPSEDHMNAFRQKVYAWKKLRQLGPICREKLVENAPNQGTCMKDYLALLFPNAANRQPTLPQWALGALADETGYHNWLLGQQAVEKDVAPSWSSKPWIRIAFFIALLITGAWYVYKYFDQPVSTENVFASNFSPPESLMADMQLRHGDEPTAAECLVMFKIADEQYQAGNMESAQEPLMMLVIDSTQTACHSDAWYYMGVVRLAMDDPKTAIECFAKIENLEAFGEDLYWYQGLAFVRLAVNDPSRRDLARRAVERALANTSRPDRKQQAAEMLKDLSE